MALKLTWQPSELFALFLYHHCKCTVVVLLRAELSNTCCDLNAWGEEVLGVARSLGIPLAELLQVVHLHVGMHDQSGMRAELEARARLVTTAQDKGSP